MSTSHAPLVNAFDHQDQIFGTAFNILQDAIIGRVFPAASIAVTHLGRLVALKALGSLTYDDACDDDKGGAPFLAPFARSGSFTSRSRSLEPGSAQIHTSTPFDLASLTKVAATTPMAMLLHDRGQLDLNGPISAIVPEFLDDEKKDVRRKNATVRNLLAHSSGLPAYEKLFLKAASRDELLNTVFTMPLIAAPGTRADYSDIGFILLGVALERLAAQPLDRFCQQEIFNPLAMTAATFNPPPELRSQIPPTADERKNECGAGAPARELSAQHFRPSPRSTHRNRIIQGEVQDENAYLLNGLAAHAGLFSTARDLATFAHALLTTNSIFRRETVALFARRELTPVGTSRALGWDTPSTPSQSGKYYSPASFGHLGYTGTSLWIDPTRHLSITLLTNRTWPDCSDRRIQQIRPQFHNAIIESLM